MFAYKESSKNGSNGSIGKGMVMLPVRVKQESTLKSNSQENNEEIKEYESNGKEIKEEINTDEENHESNEEEMEECESNGQEIKEKMNKVQEHENNGQENNEEEMTECESNEIGRAHV